MSKTLGRAATLLLAVCFCMTMVFSGCNSSDEEGDTAVQSTVETSQESEETIDTDESEVLSGEITVW